MDLESTVEKTITEIQKLMNANSIVGTPIKTPDKTIIPISRAALGFGVGVGSTKSDTVAPLGGAGGGGSIDPIGFLVIYNNVPGPDGIDLVLIENQDTTVEEILNTLGGLVWDFLGGREEESSEEVPIESPVDNVITKIRPSSDDED